MPGTVRDHRHPLFPLLVGAFVLAGRLHAQAGLVQIPPDCAQFAAQDWQSSDGLPQNTGKAIVQTRDGHVWIGTIGGLCRYGGDQMEVFDTVSAPGLRSNRIEALLEGHDGTLWIGTDRGGVARYREGRFASLADHAEVSVQALAEDAHDRLLVATKRQVLRLAGDRLLPVHPELHNVRGLHRRRSGAMLAMCADGLFEFADGADADQAARRLVSADALCVAEIGDQLLLGTENGLGLVGDGAFRPWQPLPLLAQPILALLPTHDGALWIGTNTRVVRIDHAQPGQPATTPEPPLLLAATAPNAARTLAEDRDGGIWIGHTETGVTRLQRAEVMAYAEPNGLPGRGITSVLADRDGSILVGTALGLYRGRGGHFALIPSTTAFGACRAALCEPDGTLWFGAVQGLVRRPPGGDAALWLEKGDPLPTEIRAMRRIGDDLWIGGEVGLTLLRDRTLSPPPFAAELANASVRTIERGPDGAVWIGGANATWRISPDGTDLRRWHCGAELPWGEVRAILPEPGDHAWIGSYGGGLIRIDDNRVRVVGRAEGLRDQSVCAVIPRPEHLLLVSNSGLAMVRRGDLEAVVAGTAACLACRQLHAEGSREPECSGGVHPCASDIDGHLWWCGIRSLYEFTPEAIDLTPEHPPVLVRELFAGDRRWGGVNEITLPTGLRAISLHLGTCSFHSYRDVRYRWRVLGMDDGWSQPGYAAEVRLPALTPGDLVFEAEAIGFDGTVSTQPARVTLHVPFLLTERTSFRIAVLLAGAAAMMALVHFAARRAQRRAAELQATVGERTQELRLAQQELEQRVADRTRALQEALDRQHRDMAERERLERELRQLQRMESLGMLAGGIAHDFNNILTVALGASQVLAGEVDTADGRETCESLRAACERGRGLTQHLLAVASRQLVQAQRLDLARVVDQLLPVLRALLGEDVALTYQGPSQPLAVVAATTQIEQILLNLCGNARDALPRGGEVVVRIAADDRGAVLSVRDNGTGMSRQVLERVFEPFFSTKGRRGRGLGLATVYGITKQLGGNITIDSAVDQGTTVTIALPLAAAAANEPAAAPPAGAAPPATSGDGPFAATVLLIEDEAEVRRVLGRMLQRLGCTVLEARNGDEGLQALRAAGSGVDIVLSDVVMPGLRGKDLVQAMHGLRPDLPIVFASGYLDGRLIHHDLTAMGLEILEKPIDGERLAAALRRRLPGRAFDTSR